MKTSNRLRPGIMLLIGVLLVCAAQAGLLHLIHAREASSRPAHVRDAQERMLRARAALMALRERLPLTEEQRTQLTRNDPNGTGFIGLEWTPLTTTDGSLASKRLSTDLQWIPQLDAMLVQCEEMRRDSDVVWIGASGSFPALTAATVLVCESRGLRPLVISSLTASSHGANVPGADWLTMEKTLREAGVIETRSVAASVGGEGDRGLGLDPIEVAALQRRVRESDVPLIDPADVSDSVSARLSRWREAGGVESPLAFVNVGGNVANLGPHREAASLRPGLNLPREGDADSSQGLSLMLLRQNVPVIHLLNLDRLASTPPPVLSPAPGQIPLRALRRTLAVLGLIFVGLLVHHRLDAPSLGALGG